MSTPLGLDARQTALVLRACKLVPTRTGFRDRHGLRIGSVRARRLADDCVGRERLWQLGAPALAEAVRLLDRDRDEPLPLIVALPPRYSPESEPLGPDFVAVLAHRAALPIDLEGSDTVVADHAAFAPALERALAAVAERRGPVVVGGVASYHDPAVLAVLDEARRLHGYGTKDGFIPSEAAAFLVLAPADKEPKQAFARVVAVASGAERDDVSEEPPIGEAMTELIRSLAAHTATPIPWLLCDVNDERHRVKEWSFAMIRNRDLIDDDVTVVTRPYDELGDVDAATGAVYAAYVSQAFRLGFAPARQALVALRSEGAGRGAFVLEAP